MHLLGHDRSILRHLFDSSFATTLPHPFGSSGHGLFCHRMDPSRHSLSPLLPSHHFTDDQSNRLCHDDRSFANLFLLYLYDIFRGRFSRRGDNHLRLSCLSKCETDSIPNDPLGSTRIGQAVNRDDSRPRILQRLVSLAVHRDQCTRLHHLSHQRHRHFS